MKTCFLLLTLCLARLCLAQTPGVPGLGWIPAQSPGRYSHVFGVAGAAQAGPEAALPPHRLLVMRPAGALAALVSEEGAVALARLERMENAESARLLETAVESPAIVAWSPSGDALLLAGADRLQIWKIADDGEPALLRDLSLEVESAAVSDGGARILARTGGALYLLDEDGGMQQISRDAAGPFAFYAGSPQFAWLEGAELCIAGGAALQRIRLGEPEDGVRRLLAGAGRGKLLLAESSAEGARLTLWDSSGARQGEWLCPAEVTELRAAGAAGVILLAAPDGGPAWMADVEAVRPSVFFVPRGEPLGETGGIQ